MDRLPWADAENATCPASLGPMPTPSTLAALRTFVAERDWDQFHSPENLAKSISIEASELLECFQWSSNFDQTRVEEELADVVTYCIHLANKIGVDLDEIVMRKLQSTRAKYPVELAKGRMTKYTELAADQGEKE
ncbi:NTP pyrophosphatase (non-canonical NTP hydrolase) [Microbacterium murale]|uniref:NTP pyrophosphatase (Non-canonical NTP hydrolase) n=2 Tax=Microbacterium murale TaxID=1081040 RepID=A0ABU0P8V2_9MICO|nr:NTP pyrophosphatase (non-canonical NTP hydrolase) [Microbacterium murale]